VLAEVAMLEELSYELVRKIGEMIRGKCG
jgi:hypothetical protein